MRILAAILPLMLLTLVADPAAAADGDVCQTCKTFKETAGPPIYLCDSKTTSGACNGGTGMEPPASVGAVSFEINKDTGCSACTVEIREGAGIDEKHLLATLTCGSNTEDRLPAGIGITGLLYPNITVATGCTDLDVVGHFGGK